MLGQNNSYNSGPLIYTPKKGPNALKTAREKKRSGKLPLILDIVVVLLVAGATFAMFKLTNIKPENTEKNNPEVVAEVPGENESDEKFAEFNLQPVINSWFSTFSRETEKGIMIYDLDNDKVVGKLDEEKVFGTASVYKLFVVYEGYKRVELGDWREDDESYGGMTVGECLDKAIRESHSGCAESLLGKIGEEEMDRIILNNYGLEKTSVEKLETTAKDMVEFLKIIYHHKEISNASFAKLADSMLNQPKIEDEACSGGVCDFRMGLPAGFSEKAKVYNKVGWERNGLHWVVYDDVALVEFPEENRHFAIAMLTAKFPTTDKITEFGELIEEAMEAYFEYE